MIVEFVGLPGSGKTTLHQRVLNKLTSLGMPLVTPAELGGLGQDEPPVKGFGHRAEGLVRPTWTTIHRILLRIVAMVVHPRLVWLVARRLCGSRRSLTDKFFAARLFAVALGDRWRVRGCARSLKTVIIDEGVVLRAFTVFEDGDGYTDPELMLRYAQRIPLPDALVYLRASPEVALQRVGSRPRGLPDRFQRIPPERLGAVMAGASERLDLLVEAVKENPRAPVAVVIINSDDLAAAEAECDRQVISEILQVPGRIKSA